MITCAIALLLLIDVTSTNYLDNVNDDFWVLKNMVKNVSNVAALGWFQSDNTDLCDWDHITCNNNGSITRIRISNVDGFGESGYFNTTYWPSMIEYVDIFIYSSSNSDSLVGSLILDNLPQTIQSFEMVIRSCGMSMNFTAFPNISHLTSLHTFKINMCYNRTKLPHTGIVTDLYLKLPHGIEYLYLVAFTMDKFPNFENFTNLTTLTIREGNITNDNESFVSSTLPPILDDLDVSGTIGLKGHLDFRSLMPRSPYLSLVDLELDNPTIQSVDFRGLNYRTHVYLSPNVGCSVNSVYGDTHNSSSSNYICINSRSNFECTGEEQCLATCRCFEIPQDWEPAFNDFYTYVQQYI